MTWGIAAAGIVGIALVVAGAAPQLSARFASAEQPASAKSLPVQVSPATLVTSYSQPRTYTGMVKAARQGELSFRRGDELIEVLVDQGDRVSAEQPLAKIDTRGLQALRDQLKAQLAQADALLAELEAGPRQEVIAAQRATVSDWKAQVALQESQLDRRLELLKDNAVSKEEFEQTSFGLDSTKARLAAAERQLDEMIAGTRQEKIDAQRAAVAQLEAAVRDVEIDIADSTLAAPYDGFITKRSGDEGAIVSSGQSIFRIVEDSPVEVWIGLPPAAAERLRVGDQQSIEVHGETYSATVTAVIAELDMTTRTRTVVLTLGQAGPNEVVPGQVARLRIEETTDRSGFWVPVASLSAGTRGLWSVFVVEQEDLGKDVVARRTVEVLFTNDDNALVRGTLEDGDRVIQGGAHRLVPGQRVAVQES